MNMNIEEIESLKNYVLTLGSDDLPTFGGSYQGGIHLQQNLDEICPALVFLKNSGISPLKFLEVGSAAGGNAYLFAHLFNIPEIFIIDNNQHPKHVHRKDILKNFNVKEFIGNSQGIEAKLFAESNGPFDIIFIDADHSESGVINDINNYKDSLKINGFLIFHDAFACPGISNAILKLLSSDNRFSNVFSKRINFGVDILQKNM